MESTQGSIEEKLLSLEDPKEQVDYLNSVSKQVRYSSPMESFSLGQKAGELAAICDYPSGLARSLCNLGQSYLNFESYPEALEKANEARDIFRELEDLKGEADCLNILGGVYYHLSDHSKRLECNIACLHLRQEIEDQVGEVGSFNNIGDTYMSMGDYISALKYFQHCLELPYITTYTECLVICNIGEVYYYLQDQVKAERYLREGLKQARYEDHQVMSVVARNFLALIYLDAENQEEAIVYLEDALEIALEQGLKEELYPTYKNLARAHEEAGDEKTAYRYLKKYNEVREGIYSEDNFNRIRYIQFQQQAKELRKETEVEREKNLELRVAMDQIESQRNEIVQKNNAITSSIIYAQRIQDAILPDLEKLKEIYANSFVFFQPRDIVSGDFFWVSKKEGENKIYFGVIDCTGHGVPGAMMSIVAYNAFYRALNEFHFTDPGEILECVNSTIVKNFAQGSNRIDDGMDASFCTLDLNTKTLRFSGANNPIYIVRQHTLDTENLDDICVKRTSGTRSCLFEIKGNRQPIGHFVNHRPFVTQEVVMQPTDMVYLFSDGYADQFGGPSRKGKKFKYKQLKELLLSIAEEPVDSQRDRMEEVFHTWRRHHDIVDDVCFMGLQL